VLQKAKIIHSDLKPDNILVDFDYQTQKIKEVKLIDFGSSFMYNNPTGLSVSTPEYLAPEILDFLENRQSRGSCEDLMACLHPWSFDVWSLGSILLEILTGCPLWLSLKSRMITAQGKSIMGTGLFGVCGRDGKKIL